MIIQAPDNFSLPEEIIKECEASLLQNPLYQIALRDREIISKMELLKESALAFKEQKGTYVNFEKSTAFLVPWRTINKQGGAPLVMYYKEDAFCIHDQRRSSLLNTIALTLLAIQAMKLIVIKQAAIAKNKESATLKTISPRSSMDRIRACGACDRGSTPLEGAFNYEIRRPN